MRWALSVRDWHCHAVDEHRNHRGGFYRAECGHLLATGGILHEVPTGRTCQSCALTQASRALLRPAAIRPRPAAG